MHALLLDMDLIFFNTHRLFPGSHIHILHNAQKMEDATYRLIKPNYNIQLSWSFPYFLFHKLNLIEKFYLFTCELCIKLKVCKIKKIIVKQKLYPYFMFSYYNVCKGMTNWLYLYICRSAWVHFKWHCRRVTHESSDNCGNDVQRCDVFVNTYIYILSYVIILYNNLGYIIYREFIILLKSNTVLKLITVFYTGCCHSN